MKLGASKTLPYQRVYALVSCLPLQQSQLSQQSLPGSGTETAVAVSPFFIGHESPQQSQQPLSFGIEAFCAFIFIGHDSLACSPSEAIFAFIGHESLLEQHDAFALVLLAV